MNPIALIIKLWKSLLYSLQGLAFVTRRDTSFRIELVYVGVSLPVLYYLPLSLERKVILFTTLILLLAMEVMNTVIELIADKLSPERSDFAGHIKDAGSAGVLLVLFASLVQWVVFLWALFGPFEG